MKVIRKTKTQVVFEGKLNKVSGRYFGFYLPREFEKQFAKAKLQVTLRKKTKR